VKVMVTLVGPFEGSDPGDGERRTFTIGEPDAATLARRIGEWAHDSVLRMVAPEVTKQEESETLWEELA
jgi:hypothetical protein